MQESLSKTMEDKTMKPTPRKAEIEINSVTTPNGVKLPPHQPTPAVQIERLKKRKAKYELIAAQYLMKANDIDEKISSLLPRRVTV